MVTQRRGARWSTADAYLRPALRRKNLRLLTNATVGRVVFENARAVGVEFERDGRWHLVRARREVVLCDHRRQPSVINCRGRAVRPVS
jgi:choline dehydrogenase